jgi:hypothetical protein
MKKIKVLCFLALFSVINCNKDENTHGTATVLITVGGISEKIIQADNKFVAREHLWVTASFDHNIVDGSPAARFMNQLTETIKNGTLVSVDLDHPNSKK